MTPATPHDIARLTQFRAERHTFNEISKRLRRSPHWVAVHVHALGLARFATDTSRRPAIKVLAWNDPDAADPGHDLDTRDLAMLDDLAAGMAPSAVGRRHRSTTSHAKELARVRDTILPLAEPV